MITLRDKKADVVANSRISAGKTTFNFVFLYFIFATIGVFTNSLFPFAPKLLYW